ncbi:MAG: MFS transporter [Geminicoccaceae bacterium]|jgi:MFS family permease|nr:MFS transporter [Geminicoccaceae bacterium]
MLHRSLIRNVSILATCQAFFFMANTIQITTSALVGLQIAPSPALATLPLAAQFVGNMLATMPASLLMARIGRRLGLLLGSLFGVLSGLLATWAVVQASYPLFMTAGLLYGVFGAFSQYFRFTAADAADASDARDKVAARARAIALVMAGGLVAAVLGPELAKATQDLLPPFVFAGCYLMIATVAFCCGVALAFLDLPHKVATTSDAPARPLLEIVRKPEAITAFAAALVAYVTMNMLMTATPLAMLACGYAFADSAMVIQWHVVGMFAPSFFSGSLIARFGAERIIAFGGLLMLACIGTNLAGIEVVNFVASLLLLGLGWNFMFIGGTTLLTQAYRPSEKAKVQGFNDLCLFSAVAASAAASGALHEWLGWQPMNIAALPLLLAVILLAVIRAARRPLAAPV